MTGMKTYRTAILIIAVFMLALVPSGSLLAKDINLVPDKATILRLERPASTIIIGNPAIADATIRSGTLMVLMGKSYGSTNLIALDSTGEEIVHMDINVAPSEHRALWLYKGVDHASYVCNPRCARVLAIGDEKGSFNHVLEQTKKKTDLASGGGGGSTGSPPQ